MPIDHRSVLSNIHRFDQLIKYLRDEMGWPISQDSFDDDDDLFYDFTTEELGIDMKNAAKIQRIQRLRPLSTHQPWGIFFVKFEPKHLPVVALRRILGQVALKKRVSANNPEQAAWSADDLLFVSNYGEGESRQISFAHFSQSEVKKNLPTLKVLGWDNFDTKLHLDHVADFLTEKLSWPDDEENQIEWRKQWRSAFTLTHKEVINTSKNLSKELAVLARNIRDRIKTILAIETEDGPITKLMESFRKSLIHDLDETGFADMYAQTIAYGLLSARITNPSGDSADDIIEAMPVTNPFLKELMETFLSVGGRKKSNSKLIEIDFDELGVSEIVELLDASNMEAVVRDFGDRNPQEDPVIHFFEGFLEEYDKKIRKDRGVFYTPRPVVSFIVRSVDEQLRTEFNLEDGLADITTWREMAGRFDNLAIPEGVSPEQAFVQILDPATGTGTFLVEVIELINKTMTEKWQFKSYDKKKINKLWNNYVSEHLLPRLYGYELMMAPYAIAHMKIGLKLYETGYQFESDQRARIYLTNALEPAQDFSGTLAFAIPALAHEAEDVNAIKRDLRFTVVIGNPPYSGFSSNMNPWINSLLKGKLPDGRSTASYYEVNGEPLKEQKLWLQDDYVKFIRLSQFLIEGSSVGIHCFITNNSYLDGPTHRGMRFQLKDFFSQIKVINLHGSLKRNQDRLEAVADENVFDIQQGVSIGTYTRFLDNGTHEVLNRDLWGSRSEKYEWLLKQENKDSTNILLKAPWFLFVPFLDSGDADYEKFISLRDIFKIKSTSIQTSRDAFVVDFDADTLTNRVSQLGDSNRSNSYFQEEFGLKDGRNWNLDKARTDISKNSDWIESITPYLYRAFDVRSLAYRDTLINWPRHEVMNHFSNSNVALLVPRQLAGEEFQHVFCTRIICDMCVVSNATKEAVQAYPLWLKQQDIFFGEVSNEDQNNLSNDFVRAVESQLSLRFSSAKTLRSRSDQLFGPQDCFDYIYAILHSPNYRSNYRQFLKLDFPRIPLSSSSNLFFLLAAFGNQLVSLHLMESKNINNPITYPIGQNDFLVEQISYSSETVWINKEKTRGFEGIPEEVWSFYIGGYQVCEKWLKDRGPKKGNPGRVLTDEDIEHYQKIVVALSETIRIMTEIDEVIENHGGWPGAFQDS
jgi:predicted helicase